MHCVHCTALYRSLLLFIVLEVKCLQQVTVCMHALCEV